MVSNKEQYTMIPLFILAAQIFCNMGVTEARFSGDYNSKKYFFYFLTNFSPHLSF